MRKRLYALLTAILLSVTLTGCGGMRIVFDPEELYTLPTLPAKYTELSGQSTPRRYRERTSSRCSSRTWTATEERKPWPFSGRATTRSR